MAPHGTKQDQQDRSEAQLSAVFSPSKEKQLRSKPLKKFPPLRSVCENEARERDIAHLSCNTSRELTKVMHSAKTPYRLPANVDRRLRIPLSVGALCLIWLFFSYFPSALNNSGTTKVDLTPRNRTLGFGEIFMAVLPTRTDHRDTATLLAHFSELDITVIDGVTNFSRKALPKGTGGELNDGELGCWRVHMNFLRTVVEKRLETALVIEADADWDVRIKDQLTTLSENLPDSTARYPYGSSWRFFFLANCIHYPDEKKKGPFITYEDKTVGSMKDQLDWVKQEAAHYGVKGDDKRIIGAAFKPLCTTAYAVTLDGAIRMLYEMGYEGINRAIDVEYRRATMSGKLPSLALTPPLMGQFRTGSATDSEIRNTQVKEKNMKDFKPGAGPQVRQSARMALREQVYADTTLDWAHIQTG